MLNIVAYIKIDLKTHWFAVFKRFRRVTTELWNSRIPDFAFYVGVSFSVFFYASSNFRLVVLEFLYSSIYC